MIEILFFAMLIIVLFGNPTKKNNRYVRQGQKVKDTKTGRYIVT